MCYEMCYEKDKCVMCCKNVLYVIMHYMLQKCVMRKTRDSLTHLTKTDKFKKNTRYGKGSTLQYIRSTSVVHGTQF